MSVSENEVADETPQSAAESAEGADPLAQESGGSWPVDRLRPLIEALLFAAGDPLPAKKMVEFVEGSTLEEVKATLEDLATEYLTRGIRLLEIAGGWQMRTAPEHQRYVRKLFRERPQRLTRAATETIAIVAYKQPVTRQEIEAVRGVDSGGVLESLVERRLAKVIGRREVAGRPLVYATTQEFLELFGLRSIRELPTLAELGNEFERMSEQGGFSERQEGEISPLEGDDGAQDEATEGEGEDGSGRSAAEPESGDEIDGEEVAGQDEGRGENDEKPDSQSDE